MGSDFFCNLHLVIPINRLESHNSLSRKNTLHVISRTQFPLMLAYAYTIHKVHMLTIPNTVVTLNFPEPTGQIYVCRIFMEHSHDIFSEYSKKVPYEILGNIPK